MASEGYSTRLATVIGRRIRTARLALHPTPSQASCARKVGVVQGAWSAWEQGEYAPPRDREPAICQALDAADLFVGIHDEAALEGVEAAS